MFPEFLSLRIYILVDQWLLFPPKIDWLPGTRFKGNLEVELGSQDREDLQAIQDWWRSGGFPKEDL